MRNSTKQIIAETLLEMNKTVSLERIRVQELCKRCDISTQTFYNHFKDKFEVVKWIYNRDMKDVDEQFGIGNSIQFLHRLQAIEKRKSFYRNAVNAGSYDSLFFSLIKDVTDQFETMYETAYNKQMDQDLKFVTTTHAAGVSYMVCQWIKGALDVSLEKLVQLIHVEAPENLRSVYVDYKKTI